MTHAPATLEAYVEMYPDHQVTVVRNVQASTDDKRLRVTFEQRRGPYRPVVLGVYVVESIKDAIKQVINRPTADKEK